MVDSNGPDGSRKPLEVDFAEADASSGVDSTSPAKNADGSKPQFSPLTQRRLDLLARGFTPTPVMGKRPLMDGWQKKKNPTPDEVAAWEGAHPTWRNTGVVTQITPFIDIDILKAEAADSVEALARERFGSCGKILVRIGQAPKRAIPLKAAAPFKKMSVVFDNGEKIEFLGDGQMVVVHGIHPDTGQPYAWRGEVLWEVARNELPEITEDEARQFLDDAAKMLVEQFGYAVKIKRDVNRERHEITESRPPEDPEKVKAILAVIPSDDRDVWFEVCCALVRISRYSPNYDWFALWDEWSARCPEKYDADEVHAKWHDDVANRDYPYSVRTLYYYAKFFNPTWSPPSDTAVAVRLDDFRAYMPLHNYVFMATREHWPAASVNSRIPPLPVLDHNGDPVMDERGRPKKIKANAWLDAHRPVEQMTWAPGEPAVISGRLIEEEGWFDKPGASCLNRYRPPRITLGDRAKARRWVRLVYKVYPRDAKHVIRYFAQRVQRPGEKINHSLVLGGAPGIGKDTIIEPLRQAVGPSNFQEASPNMVLGDFNPFVQGVVLRVNEMRDSGEFDRFQVYERMKTYSAAPPFGLRVNDKYLRHFTVLNCVSPIITANRKESFYLPADDRRHYVAWSTLTAADFTVKFWNDTWAWYLKEGGLSHVAALLATLDLSEFNPFKPPDKTPAFWEIVQTNRVPEDAELIDALEELGNPDAVTIMEITHAALRLGNNDFFHHLRDRRHARALKHRMGESGYASVYNPARASDGRWKVGNRNHVVWTKAELSLRQKHEAVAALIKMAAIDIARVEAELEDRRRDPQGPRGEAPSSIWA
jgi:hypothetical protein